MPTVGIQFSHIDRGFQAKRLDFVDSGLSLHHQIWELIRLIAVNVGIRARGCGHGTITPDLGAAL